MVQGLADYAQKFTYYPSLALHLFYSKGMEHARLLLCPIARIRSFFIPQLISSAAANLILGIDRTHEWLRGAQINFYKCT